MTLTRSFTGVHVQDANLVLIQFLELDGVAASGSGYGGDAYAAALLVVRQFHGRIGFQGDFTGKSLEFRVFHLGVGRAFGVVRRFAVRFVLPVLVLPVLPVGGGFLLFFFLCLGLLPFTVAFVLGFLPFAGREFLVDLFQERREIVQRFQVEASVYRSRTLVVDGIAVRSSVFQFHAAFPGIVGRVVASRDIHEKHGIFSSGTLYEAVKSCW